MCAHNQTWQSSHQASILKLASSQLFMLLKQEQSLIVHVYPGSSTHPKVVFREVLYPIELEFGKVDFLGERKYGEKPLGAE